MTDVRVASIDAYLLRRGPAGLETLVLQRAVGTRCAGAWEVVHGFIEDAERPEQAAEREIREETGLTVARLYSVSVHPFYIAARHLVTLAVVFGAFVEAGALTLGTEHARAEWLPLEDARARLTWPRSRAALDDIAALLATGDAGVAEDVLRVGGTARR